MNGLRDESAVRIGHTLNLFGEIHIFALEAFAVCNDLPGERRRESAIDLTPR
jgi:hypothetical protein